MICDREETSGDIFIRDEQKNTPVFSLSCFLLPKS